MRYKITLLLNSILSDKKINSSYRRILATLIFASCVVFFFFTSASAQNIQFTKNNVDSQLRSDLKVDPSTQALQIQVPLGNYPGRAGFSLPITLSYSSKVWRVEYQGYNPGHHQSDGTTTGAYTIAAAKYGEHSVSGWTTSLGFPVLDTLTGTQQMYDLYGTPSGTSCMNGQCYNIDRIQVWMPDGSSHELRSSDQPIYYSDPHPDDLYSVDGSRLHYKRSIQTLFLPDGSRYLMGSWQYIDRNGNTLAYDVANNRWTDTLGRTINSPFPNPGVTNPTTVAAGDQTYSLPGVNNSTISYTLRWKHLDDAGVLTTPQPLAYISDTGCGSGGPNSPHLFSYYDSSYICNGTNVFNPVVLYQIVLPTQQAYTFTYNTYGEIDKVVLPTGGYERYQYQYVKALSAMKGPYDQGNRGVSDRWVSTNGTGNDEAPPWHYEQTGSWQMTGLGEFVMSIIAPDGSLTERRIHTDPALSQTFGYSIDQARAGMAYDERFYSVPDGNGNRTMLRRKLTDWALTGSNAANQYAAQKARRNPRVAKEVEIIFNTSGSALAKTTTYDYDTTYQFDVGVEQTLVSEYDYISISQGAAQSDPIGSIPNNAQPVRTTQTSYLTSDANYRSRNLLSLPTSTIVKDGLGNIIVQSTISYDETALLTYSNVTGWTDPAVNWRGNVTAVSRWLNTTNSYLQTHTQYDQCGNVRKAWDARDTSLTNPTQTSYVDNFADGLGRNTYAYSKTVTSPTPDTGTYGSDSAFTTTSIYDFNTGLVTSTVDANTQTTEFEYNDPLNRLTKEIRPDGGETTTQYGDGTGFGNLYLKTETKLDATRVIASYQYFDGLGRAIRSGEDYDGSNWSVKEAQYDSMGRVWKVSNAYNAASLTGTYPSPSANWIVSQYDALSREISKTYPDSAPIFTVYSGDQTTVHDQANKQRRITHDALGRLTKVEEMLEYPSTAIYATTTYGYDALDNLTNITQFDSQNSQTRTFVFNSLKQLTDAINPESGHITYDYDANGNLWHKTDARGTVTTLSYDALNRLYKREYSNDPNHTPTITFKYDGVGVQDGIANSKGKVTSVSTSGSFASGYTYDVFDVMGRVKQSTQTVDGQSYVMTYGYDLAGNQITEIYPSGRIVTTGYDAAGNISSIAGQKTGEVNKTYADSFTYAPHGAVQSVRLGNSLWEHTNFNSRLQPWEIGLGATSTDSSKLKLNFTYGRLIDGVLDTAKNTGDVQSQTITSAGVNFTQTYTYDHQSRLLSAQETSGESGTWKQTFVYDIYGNRTFDMGNTTMPLSPPNPSTNPANNRISDQGYGYDQAGNLITAPSHTYTYDAENKQIKFDEGNTLNGGATYAYDGNAKRVKKVDGSGTTIFVYDTDGQLVAEYTNAAASGTGGTSYLTDDGLGSPRIVTDASGAVKSRHDYMPFGEEITRTAAGYGVADGIRQKFTGKQHDTESGLDYFEARYYSSSLGRFTSPDEFGGGPDEFYDFTDQAASNPTFYADLSDPQSLNKYNYAYNNPLLYIDPDGHQNVATRINECREGAENAVKGAFTMGVLGQPGDNDSLTKRICDVVGTAVTTVLSDVGFNLGGGSEILSGGSSSAVSVPLAATSAFTFAGSVAHGGQLILSNGKATTNLIFNKNSGQGGKETVEQRADRLSDEAGKNSVTVDSPNSRTRVDLRGKPHYDKATKTSIRTPHVQSYKKNMSPTNPSKVNYSRTGTRPATHRDLRIVEKVLNLRKKQQ